MIPLVNYRHKYVLYYNPKSACTTYRRVFVAMHANELEKEQLVDKTKAAQFWKPVEGKPYAGFFAFTIVRNPFDRLVSAYLDKCFEWKYPDDTRHQNQRFQRSIHGSIHEFLGRPVDYTRGFSFREFVTYLDAHIETPSLNIHFKPQAYLRKKVDAYYRVEDSAASLESIYRYVFRHKPRMFERFETALARELGKDGTRRVNSSLRPTDSHLHVEPFADFTFEDFNQLRSRNLKPHYPSFYDSQLVDAVRRIYSLEFFRYQYDPMPR